MIKAKKHFGQNFLQDSFYLDKIISAMSNTTNTVVEIGPGLGDLTNKLISKRQVISIEVDKELEGYLVKKFSAEISSGAFRLIIGDATSDSVKNSLPERYDLVANLPYYVATNIILEALTDKRCKNILVLMQKEVAHKFCAPCQDSEYGSISVLAEIVSRSREVLFDIPPEAFTPQPKVVSSVFKIAKLDEIDLEVFSNVSKILRVAFVAPRKTLFKNLSIFFDKDKVEQITEELQIDRKKRPHEITAKDFISLSGCLIKNN
jgi:16S rRNA (adenine1518-N6/adenine1519-N6)-dimethyltransferase